jgi:hypothetical protein
VGWLKSIGSFITGGSQVSRDIFDKDGGHLKTFGAFVGNLRFTKEDMAEMDAETAVGVRKFAIDTLAENTERSKTRRDLAIFIIKYYAMLLFIAGILYKVDPEWSAFWFKLATETELGWLVMGVGLFFWGTHTIRSTMKAEK